MDAAADDGVVVDIVFEDGVFYLELANLADRPALNVTCSFDVPLVDAHGRTCPSWACSATWRFSGHGDGCARCSTPSRATSDTRGPRASRSPSNTSGQGRHALRPRCRMTSRSTASWRTASDQGSGAATRPGSAAAAEWAPM